MVTCEKCKTVNPPAQRHCSNCQRDLLPGMGFLVRFLGFLLCLAIAVFSAWVVWRIYKAEHFPDLGYVFTSPIWWALMALILPFAGLSFLLRRTPDHERYFERAKRHVTIDKDQALADFNEAVRLAPEKGRVTILKERAKLLEAMGDTKQAFRDRIAVAGDPGAHEGAANLTEMIGGDRDVFLNGQRKIDHENLMKTRAVGIGYCPSCGKPTVLTLKSKCQLHPNRGIKDIRLAVPEDIEKVKTEMMDKRRRDNRKRLIGWIVGIIGIVILCVVFKYIIGT
jgi:hypothetical protein